MCLVFDYPVTMFRLLADVLTGFVKNIIASRPDKLEPSEKRTRRSGLLRAKEIHIIEEPGHPSTTANGLERRRVCTATVDGVSYRFELIFKHNAFDGSKYTNLANDAWIEITGPSNQNPKQTVTAHLDYFREPPQWRTKETVWRPVAVKQAVRQWLNAPLRERGE